MNFNAEVTKEARNIYYKIKYHQICMMKRQGYDTSEESSYEFFKEFGKEGMEELFMNHYLKIVRSKKLTVPESLTKLYINKEGTKKQCYYMNESNSATGQVLVDQVRKMLGETKDIRNIVIIAPKKLGAETRTTLIDFPSYTFTRFEYSELKYNPFDNDLVPEHTLLTYEETRSFYKNNPSIKEEDLPLIYETDAIIKRLNGKSNQIVYIKRKTNRPESVSSYSISIRRIITGIQEKKR